MPELNPEYAKFEKEIKTLLEELLTRLKQGNFTDVELAQLSAEIDFFEELKANGFEATVNKFFNNYDKEIAAVFDEAVKRGVRNIVGIDDLLLIKELDKDFLLKRAAAWGSQWEGELIKSLIRGDTITETIKNMSAIPLTDAQLGTVINTSYTDISRLATVQAYESKPEQRFKYVGGEIPTSSEQCIWMIENQKSEGYTMAEIKAGIVTPFTHKYGELAGQPKIINELGREPNYNCIHRWESM